MLAREVKEKQELISALNNEKHSLVRKLKLTLKEIQQEKNQIKSKMKAQADAQAEALLFGENLSDVPVKTEEEKTLPAETQSLRALGKQSRNLFISTSSSQEVIKGKSESQHPTPRMAPMLVETTEEAIKKEPLQIGQVFDQHEQRVAILQKDREIYNNQYKKLSMKVDSLKAQLAESLQEIAKCNKYTNTIDKKILEDISTNKVSKADVSEILSQLEHNRGRRDTGMSISLESQYLPFNPTIEVKAA